MDKISISFISKKFGICKHVKWKIVLWSYFGVLCLYFYFFLFFLGVLGGGERGLLDGPLFLDGMIFYFIFKFFVVVGVIVGS